MSERIPGVAGGQALLDRLSTPDGPGGAPPGTSTLPAASGPNEYSVHVTTARQAGGDLARLWSEGGLANPHTKLDWYYRRHPVGEPAVLRVRHEASAAWVGSCTLGWRSMQIGTRAVTAANRCDLVVLPSHRAGKASVGLLRQVASQGRSRAALVYGFPNQRAAPAVAAAGFARLGTLSSYNKLISPIGLLERKLPAALRFLARGLLPTVERAGAALVRSVDRALRGPQTETRFERLALPDASFDALWAAQAQSDLLIGVRDRAFLAWRFDPAVHPDLQLCAARDASGALIGYAVLRVGDGAIDVLDFLALFDDGASLRRLMTAVFRHAREMRMAVVRVGFFGAESVDRTLRGLGMVRRQGRQIHACGDVLDEIPVSRFYLTRADEDV